MKWKLINQVGWSHGLTLLGWGLAGTGAIGAEAVAKVASGPTGKAFTIKALVAEAMRENPELSFYRAEIESAKAGRKSAAAPAYPELSTQVGYKGVDDLRGRLLGEGVAWQVSVVQPLEWPGRLALRKAIANGDVELAELGFSQFQSVLAARIRGLAYHLYIAREQAAAAHEVAARLQALQEVLLQRETAGLTPLLETRIIEGQALTLRHRAREADLAMQAVRLELNRLRGEEPQAALIVAAAKLRFEPLGTLERLVEAARKNNFDIRIKEAELAQQGFAVSLAKRARGPGVTVGPYVGQERAADRETHVGVSLSVPLPLWRRPENNAALAEAREDLAEAALWVTVRRIEQEVVEQALSYQASEAEIRSWPKDALDRFREAAETADRHYRLGAVPVATYVELQRQYLEALEAMWSTQQQALEAAQKLAWLTGLKSAVQVMPGKSQP